MPLRVTIAPIKFAHKGLQALYEHGRTSGLPQHFVPRIRRVLADLDAAVRPGDLDIPGYRLRPLKGDRAGQWSVRASGDRRVVFRF